MFPSGVPPRAEATRFLSNWKIWGWAWAVSGDEEVKSRDEAPRSSGVKVLGSVEDESAVSRGENGDGG